MFQKTRAVLLASLLALAELKKGPSNFGCSVPIGAAAVNLSRAVTDVIEVLVLLSDMFSQACNTAGNIGMCSATILACDTAAFGSGRLRAARSPNRATLRGMSRI